LQREFVHPQHSTSPLLNPTTVDVVQTDTRKIVVGYTNGDLCLYDVETGKYNSFESPTVNGAEPLQQLNKVITHPILPDVVVAAYEDRHIRFFDLQTQKCVADVVAHMDAVTSLSIDPLNPHFLFSVGHDSRVQMWNLQTRASVQELSPVGLKKFDESLLCCAHYAQKPSLFAVGTSDSSVKIFCLDQPPSSPASK